MGHRSETAVCIACRITELTSVPPFPPVLSTACGKSGGKNFHTAPAAIQYWQSDTKYIKRYPRSIKCAPGGKVVWETASPSPQSLTVGLLFPCLKYKAYCWQARACVLHAHMGKAGEQLKLVYTVDHWTGVRTPTFQAVKTCSIKKLSLQCPQFLTSADSTNHELQIIQY